MKNSQARMISFALIAVAGSGLFIGSARFPEAILFALVFLAIGFLGFCYEMYCSHRSEWKPPDNLPKS